MRSLQGCLVFLGQVCVTLIVAMVVFLVFITSPLGTLIVATLALGSLHYLLSGTRSYSRRESSGTHGSRS